VDEGKIFKKSMEYLERISQSGKIEACGGLELRKAFADGYRLGFLEGQAESTTKKTPQEEENK